MDLIDGIKMQYSINGFKRERERFLDISSL